MTFDASSIRQLAFGLENASRGVQQRADLVLRKTAFDIVAEAKNKVPVDTGNLKGSIGADFTHLHAVIGPTAEYGMFVEYGTSRMAPQPYMGPAADRHLPLFERAMAQLGFEALNG